MRLPALFAITAFGFSLSVACGDDHHDDDEHGHGPGSPECDEIAVRCHPYDMDDGALGDECHNFAHDGDTHQCEDRHAECLAACPETGTGGTGSGGSSNGGTSGGGTSRGGSSGATTGGTGGEAGGQAGGGASGEAGGGG